MDVESAGIGFRVDCIGSFPKNVYTKTTPVHSTRVVDLKQEPGGNLLSRRGIPHYHRRGIVSLLSSGWDQVVPMLYGRQEKGKAQVFLTLCLKLVIQGYCKYQCQIFWVLYGQASRSISMS